MKRLQKKQGFDVINPKFDQSFEYSEIDEELDDVTFKESKSSCSCKIDEIESFMFGGQSSRFWMLRKYINSVSDKKFTKIPFFSWNCLTLFLKHREVDLIIRDEDDMKNVINFLIYKLKTVDGTKNSGKNILNIMNNQSAK